MKLSPEKQDEMYIKIIESQLQYINEENQLNIDRTQFDRIKKKKDLQNPRKQCVFVGKHSVKFPMELYS